MHTTSNACNIILPCDSVCYLHSAQYVAAATGCQFDKEYGLKHLTWYTSAFVAWLHHTWHHTETNIILPGRSYLWSATSGQLDFPRTKTRLWEVKFCCQWNSCLEQLTCWTSVTWHLAERFQRQTEDISLFNCWLSAFGVFILILRSTNVLNNNKSSVTA